MFALFKVSLEERQMKCCHSFIQQKSSIWFHCFLRVVRLCVVVLLCFSDTSWDNPLAYNNVKVKVADFVLDNLIFLVKNNFESNALTFWWSKFYCFYCCIRFLQFAIMTCQWPLKNPFGQRGTTDERTPDSMTTFKWF